MKAFTIKIGTAEEAYELSCQIPEFANPYTLEEYNKRLKDKKNLILIANDSKKQIGFKVGYSLNKQTFYSWLGGVTHHYRRSGVAKALMFEQEAWAKSNQFEFIEIKTRNCFKSMLFLCLKQEYKITDVITKTNINQNRIILKKDLKII